MALIFGILIGAIAVLLLAIAAFRSLLSITYGNNNRQYGSFYAPSENDPIEDLDHQEADDRS